VRGKNLFHSFERFDVPTRGRVTFTGPGRLDNVISRVTGGEPSSIDGTLASRVPGADVYLVNPSGILFGPNARLDVPGSFHASTADEVRFEGGEVFSAVDPSGSTLSVAAPQAFGFLGGGEPGAIAVDRGRLEVPAGEALSLVGGDVTVDAGGDGLLDGGEAGLVRARSGTVTLAALAGRGAVDPVGGAVAGGPGADVRLRAGGAATAPGDGGGTVRVRAGRLALEGRSAVGTVNTGARDPVGEVDVAAGAVLVEGGSVVSSSTLGDGDAGPLAVRAGSVEVRDGSGILSATVAGGDAGRLTVEAGRLLVEGLSQISSGTDGAVAGAGDGGAVRVAADRLEVRDRAFIGAGTTGEGDAGSVTVEAGRMLIAGDGSVAGIESRTLPGSRGDAGRVVVGADELEMRAGGAILTDTAAGGDGGEILVRAGELTMGGGGPGVVAAVISAGTSGAGVAGDVRVEAGRLRVRDNALVSSSTNLPAGGGVTAGGFGDAGAVTVRADEVEVVGRGAAILSATRTDGAAGRVGVAADRAIVVAEGGEISTNSISAGRAGDVEVDAPRLVVRDGGGISSSGLAGAGGVPGGGPAGDVRLRAGTLLVEDAGVFTQGASAAGGRISVEADRAIALVGARVTSDGDLPARGTSLIRLGAPAIALLDGSLVTSLTGGEVVPGSGEASVAGGLTFVSEDSLVAASTSVELTGVDNEVGSGLQLPAGAFLSADSLLGRGCAARGAGGASTFTQAGRGGLPPSPDKPLASTSARPEALRAGSMLRMASSACGGVAAGAGG
jgi:filamentous hemagglutinin family protein